MCGVEFSSAGAVAGGVLVARRRGRRIVVFDLGHDMLGPFLAEGLDLAGGVLDFAVFVQLYLVPIGVLDSLFDAFFRKPRVFCDFA